MTTDVQPAPSVPALSERALAPDLARGGMLLLIAFAHAPLYVAEIDRGPAAVNDVLSVFHLIFVHNHARPMFAFLFGYALVQLLDRQLARGGDWVGTRKLLRRRGWWLIAFGFLHLLLLTPLDILAAYGLAGVLLTGLLRAKDSTLLWVAGLTLVPATAAAALGLWLPLSQGLSSYASGSIAVGDRDLVELVLGRLQMSPFGLVIGTTMVVPAVILGIWAARRRVLDQPAEHRVFLIRGTVIASIVSIAGALPAVLIDLGLWADPGPVVIMVASVLQPLTGYFGGIALAGVIALVAIAASRGRNPLTVAVQALGQRSLTFYLFQSVVFGLVFAPFAFGLEDRLGLAGATGVAVLTWLLSLIIAELMRRGGYRGPAEQLLRRLTYRRSRSVKR